ncbi:hypothetical protein SISSUDRAFT_1056516 [Sistotremastrum suecicum HHB10207 ss-3]|uniref:Uncharacterized protein n=1 Tax=Sistotremastrum suecicum HHB10207 ss-3 TaxID=1314776 RepID=A0A165WPB6_9AGAM|nr:hypothetical protein SISSUDRAFT_1056516 [Sistotremastrum suecicum HHB10207 ss-3]
MPTLPVELIHEIYGWVFLLCSHDGRQKPSWKDIQASSLVSRSCRQIVLRRWFTQITLPDQGDWDYISLKSEWLRCVRRLTTSHKSGNYRDPPKLIFKDVFPSLRDVTVDLDYEDETEFLKVLPTSVIKLQINTRTDRSAKLTPIPSNLRNLKSLIVNRVDEDKWLGMTVIPSVFKTAEDVLKWVVNWTRHLTQLEILAMGVTLSPEGLIFSHPFECLIGGSCAVCTRGTDDDTESNTFVLSNGLSDKHPSLRMIGWASWYGDIDSIDVIWVDRKEVDVSKWKRTKAVPGKPWEEEGPLVDL